LKKLSLYLATAIFFLTVSGSFVALGWFTHAVWVLRAEADQLVKDAYVNNKIEKEQRQDLSDLNKNIEKTKDEEIPKCLRDCNFPADFFDKLRSQGFTKGF